MVYKQDMFEASQARIMRIELQLLDLPGRLSEMSVTDHDGHKKNLFADEDDIAVAKLESVRSEKNSFLPYYRDFRALKEKYSFNVNGYGRFALVSNGYVIIEAVERFNADLLALRREVGRMLMKKYMSSWQNEHIRRFNPRTKLGMYLLPKFFVEDSSFVKQLTKTFMVELQKESIDITWLLAPSVHFRSRRKTIEMKDAKGEVCASYLEDQLAKQF